MILCHCRSLAQVLSVAALLALANGCAAADRPAPTAATPPLTPSAQPTRPPANVDRALCHDYADAARSARTPIDAMRMQAVLVPFIDYIELGTHEIATHAASAGSPAIAPAMREVAAAQEDLDAQGTARLAAGADPTTTPVRLNPDRLTAALDAADKACATVT